MQAVRHDRLRNALHLGDRLGEASSPLQELQRGGVHADLTPKFRVELGEDGSASVTGELTIRGVSRSVAARGTYQLPTEDPFGTYRAGLELRTTVDRRDWDMDWQVPLPGGGDALGWEVEITAQLELTRKD